MPPVPVPMTDVPGAPTFEPGANYGTLKQTSDEYDAKQIEELEDLYKGGYTMARKARQYLPQLVGEHPTRYAERCKVASYEPVFSQIVDQFTSDVFGQPLSVKPAADADNPNTPGDVPDKVFYPAFEANVDRRGKSLVDLMVDVLRTALKHGRAVVCIDAPDAAGATPVSRADEDAQGFTRLYAYELPVDQLIDWKSDDHGGFVYCWLRKQECDRPTPFSRRETIRETFTLWEMAGGVAVWSRYVVEYPKDKPPKDDQPVPKTESGTTTFKRIPVLRFELPDGLWVGNKVGTQQREHYQRRAALISAENRSLVAIPYVAQGPQAPAIGGSIPADVAMDQSRGENPVERFTASGYLKLAAGDTFGFAEPDGGCYELVDKQLDKLADTMRQVTFQMAASIRPTGAALGRSGLSKQKDQDVTGRVLRALGHLIRGFAVQVFETVSMARGEDVHWTPHGLDAYESEDREQVLEEAVSLDQVQIPSATFRKIHKRVTAGKLLRGNVAPEEMSVIYAEIDDGVDDEEETRQLMKDAAKDAIQNPPAPVVSPPSAKGPPAPKASASKQPGAPGGQ